MNELGGEGGAGRPWAASRALAGLVAARWGFSHRGPCSFAPELF